MWGGESIWHHWALDPVLQRTTDAMGVLVQKIPVGNGCKTFAETQFYFHFDAAITTAEISALREDVDRKAD